jgi:hypothetical protein
MATESEIWRAASTLIEAHGEQAPRYALASAGLLIERGDFRRAEQWRSVATAATTLLQIHPAAGDQVH